MDNVKNKILIVDDSAAILTVMNGILGELYKVYPVNSGVTALRFLERQKPDLILLDVEMPEMGGIELFHKIRSELRLSDIPVIFLTAYGDIENEAEIFRLGANDYIRKPVNGVIMLARVKMHLELAAYRRSSKLPEEILKNSSEFGGS